MVATLPSNIGNAHSTANGATSTVDTITASTAGTLIVLFVCVVGTGTPTVTSVTDNIGTGTWTQAQHTPLSTTQFTDIWIQVNNPGGITTVTANLGGTVQGVSSTSMEVAGVGSAVNVEFAAGQTGTATTTVPELTTKAPVASQELALVAVGYTAPTTFLTLTTRAPDWNWNPATGSLSDVVSTGGTNNSELRTYVCSNGPDVPYLRGTLGASSSFSTAYVRLLLSATTGLEACPAGGINGYMAPQFFSGMIGG